MSNIQLLTTEVQRLSQSVDSWNTGIIVMMIVAAMAATGLVLTQYTAFRKAGLLADAQERLLKEKDKEAEKTAQELRLDIAKANQAAAEAKQKAEEDRLARVKIEQRLADRKLTDAQVAVIVDKLKVFADQEFEVTPYWELREPMATANRIADALTLAGWKYIPPKSAEVLLGGVAGVLVYVHPSASERTKKAADSLVSALTKEGIASELRGLNDPKNPTNKLHLNVGTKP